VKREKKAKKGGTGGRRPFSGLSRKEREKKEKEKGSPVFTWVKGGGATSRKNCLPSCPISKEKEREKGVRGANSSLYILG